MTVNLKYQLQQGIINSNYLMNCFLYQIFKINFESAIKKDETLITHKQESVLKELKIEFHLKLRLVLI